MKCENHVFPWFSGIVGKTDFRDTLFLTTACGARHATVARAARTGPAWLLRRCHQFGREEQSHRAAAVIAAVDRRAFQVVAQRLLLVRARADVDEPAVGASPFLDRPPGPFNARLVIVLGQPAAADTALHGQADHAGARVFVVALRMVDALLRRVIVGPVTQSEREAERGETIATPPRGLAQGRMPRVAVAPQAQLPHRS